MIPHGHARCCQPDILHYSQVAHELEVSATETMGSFPVSFVTNECGIMERQTQGVRTLPPVAYLDTSTMWACDPI